MIIQSLFFWALVFVFNILWFSIKLPAQPKSPMYLAEKIWFLSFCISMLQQLSVPVLLAIVGYFSPRLLLQDFAILLVNLLFSWLTFQVLAIFPIESSRTAPSLDSLPCRAWLPFRYDGVGTR